MKCKSINLLSFFTFNISSKYVFSNESYHNMLYKFLSATDHHITIIMKLWNERVYEKTRTKM